MPKSAGYAKILSKGIEKWQAFDRKFDHEEDYFFLFEDGSHAMCLPGQEEDFQLEKYRTELGTDYKRITMYLCTKADFEMSEDDNITKLESSSSKTVTGFGSSPGEVPKVELSSAEGISESKRSPEEVTIVEPSSFTGFVQVMEKNVEKSWKRSWKVMEFQKPKRVRTLF